MSEQIRTRELLEEIRRMRRELDILSRSARVPNISTLAAGYKSETIATAQATSSTTYTDLATVGPTVTVDVPRTGRLLILATAKTAFTLATAGGPHGGKMGVQITGTLNGTIGPLEMVEVSLGDAPLALAIAFTQSGNLPREGLIVETVTCRLKYLAISGATAPVTYSNRVLGVLPL